MSKGHDMYWDVVHGYWVDLQEWKPLSLFVRRKMRILQDFGATFFPSAIITEEVYPDTQAALVVRCSKKETGLRAEFYQKLANLFLLDSVERFEETGKPVSRVALINHASKYLLAYRDKIEKKYEGGAV